MDYQALFQISAAGMDFEKKRLEVAAMNLANMHAAAAPGTPAYKPLRVVVQPSRVDFSGLLRGESTASTVQPSAIAVVPTDAAPHLVRDPGNPAADKNGYVSYPGVDQATEMVTAMTALRAYEANVAAVGFERAMAARALDIGSQR
jgi:flagellar basal-body rod protein FlgC